MPTSGQPTIHKSRLADRGLAWLLSPTHALNLAVFRIATCLAWLIVLRMDESVFFATWPEELMGPSHWLHTLGWPATHNPALVQACCIAAYTALVFALLGIFARPALLVVLLAGGYAVTIPQLAGSIHHFNHVLIATMLLIASPCDHALALRPSKPRSTPANPISTAYAAPLRVMVLYLAIAYFFAGLWKLINVGTFWFTPTNFINQLHTKWHEFHTADLPTRIDTLPWLCAAAAAFTIVLELGWGALALTGPRGRLLAALAATFFHVTTWLFLRINFMHMAWMQVVLIDWHGAWMRLRGGVKSEHAKALVGSETRRRAMVPVLVIACVMLPGMLLNGALRRNDWPLGCYPRFDRRAHDRINVLEVRATFFSGTTKIYREDALHPFMRTSRARAIFERAMQGDPTTRENRLLALLQVLERTDTRLALARSVTFIRQSESIRPGTPDPRDQVVLGPTLVTDE